MLDTLHTFGFNDNFITWVKVIYNGICARIMNNGWKSERIDLHTLSALLFIMVAEMLSTRIRTCDQITGVQIRINNEQRPLIITQLADDTTLFVSNETDIVNALSVVDKFSEVCGLYLNKNKTEGLWLNNLVNAIIGGIKWSKQIKALGIWFGIDKSKCENFYYIKNSFEKNT